MSPFMAYLIGQSDGKLAPRLILPEPAQPGTSTVAKMVAVTIDSRWARYGE